MKVSKTKLLYIATLFFLAIPLVFMTPNAGAIDGGYVGSATCGTCHSSIKADFDKSGHPYKYQYAGGQPLNNYIGTVFQTPLLTGLQQAGIYPALMVDADLDGRLDWSAIEYTTGGFGWKLRWGTRDTRAGNDCADPNGSNCQTGYVWDAASGSLGNQYRLKTDDWNAMNYNVPAGKKYSCAICHNTNGTSSYDAGCTTDLGSGRTEPWAKTDLTPTNHGGFYSEWTFDGVQCEACHGAGLEHATAASASNIEKNLSTGGQEICAKCHVRSTTVTVNADGTGGNKFGGECGVEDAFPATSAILTSGACMGPNCASDKGFIGHHEQFNELVGYSADGTMENADGVHKDLTCLSCHNPHKRTTTVAPAVAAGLGITDNELSAEERGAVVSCESCHGNKTLRYNMGDITCTDCHMAEATSTANSWSGTWGKKGDLKSHLFKIDPAATSIKRQNAAGKYIAANALTVVFACGKCHDSSMSTFVTPALNEAQAMALAVDIHSSAPTAKFTAAPDSTTSTKVNFSAMNSTCPTGYTCTYEWDLDGDSTLETSGIVVTKTYGSTTPVSVTLKVTASAGVSSTSDSATQTVTPVAINAAPTGCSTSFTTADLVVDQAAKTVTFTDGSSDADSAAVVYVNWGDGSPMETGAPSAVFGPHTYLWNGKYTIQKTVRDSAGLTCKANAVVVINPSNGTAVDTAVVTITATDEMIDTVKNTQARCENADYPTTAYGAGTWGADGCTMPGDFAGEMTCYLKQTVSVGTITKYSQMGNGDGTCTIEDVLDGTYDVVVMPAFPYIANNASPLPQAVVVNSVDVTVAVKVKK